MRFHAALGKYLEGTGVLKAFLTEHNYKPSPEEWTSFLTTITPHIQAVVEELSGKSLKPSVSDTSGPPHGGT